MSISIFTPRSMAAVLALPHPARQFLGSLFFKTVETSQTKYVDVDVMIGARRLAPFVNPMGPGKMVERLGYTTSTVEPPLIAPKRPITVPDMEIRAPGESIYSMRSGGDRAKEILANDLADLDEMILRREEWMKAKALFTSAIPVIGDDVSLTITFPRDSSLVLGLLGATDRWTHASADIQKQIRTWRRAIVKLSGASPNIMILSPEAADAMFVSPILVGSSGTAGLMNQQNMAMGQLAPELRDSGATYLGKFAATGIDMFTYDEWFIDPADGVEKPIVPEKTILLGSTLARTVMRYGAVGVADGDGAQANIDMIALPRVPESWTVREPATRWLKVSSKPLPVPVENNAFLTAQVVA